MKKKPTISILKKKAWALCSEYIRRKAADPYTYEARCVTCGMLAYWKDLQAGHYIPGRGNSILFDERGIYVQCRACNIWKYGNPIEYAKFMEETHGIEKAMLIRDELHRLSKKPKQFTIQELEQIIDSYRRKIKLLEKQNEETTI